MAALLEPACADRPRQLGIGEGPGEGARAQSPLVEEAGLLIVGLCQTDEGDRIVLHVPAVREKLRRAFERGGQCVHGERVPEMGSRLTRHRPGRLWRWGTPA